MGEEGRIEEKIDHITEIGSSCNPSFRESSIARSIFRGDTSDDGGRLVSERRAKLSRAFFLQTDLVTCLPECIFHRVIHGAP